MSTKLVCCAFIQQSIVHIANSFDHEEATEIEEELLTLTGCESLGNLIPNNWHSTCIMLHYF